MENVTSDQLKQLQGVDPSTLQSLLGGSNGSSTSLIPESLTQTLTIGFIVLNAVSILFLIAYILSVIRKWKVQSAVLHMRKDLEEIKAHMIAPSAAAEPAPVAEPVRPVQEESRNEHEQPQS